MKNIILIDINEYALKSFLEMDDVFIAVLVVNDIKQKNEIMEKYGTSKIGEIYLRIFKSPKSAVLFQENDYNLTYDEISKYKTCQYKVEKYLTREVYDLGESQYRYYMGLKYWLGIFEKYDISAVFSMHMEHGFVYDSIPIEIAKSKNIKAFTLDIEFNNGKNCCSYFRNQNTDEIIKVKDLSDKIMQPNFSAYIHNKTASNQKRRLPAPDKFLFKYAKRYIRELLCDTFLSLRQAFMRRTNVFQYWYNLKSADYFSKGRYLKHLERLYGKISCKPVEGEKYVFYALHLEPEATIMNRGVLSNQLFIIKMISDALPESWKLYVKEHPVQFNLKNNFHYFKKNINYFRTELFYRNILDMKNTRLINLKTTSKNLIENCEAVATICGTVLLEGIKENKPVLIFGDNTSLMCKVNDVINIHSSDDVKNAMNRINNGFIPAYGDWCSAISDYLLEFPNQEQFEDKTSKPYLKDIFNSILNG